MTDSGPDSGWRSPVSAVLATSRSSTRGRWAACCRRGYRDPKLALARELGAEITVDARTGDPWPRAAPNRRRAWRARHGGVAQRFRQALGMLRRRGTISLIGLPPASSRHRSSTWCSTALPYVARSSAPGANLQESLEFAGEQKVHARTEVQPLEAINGILDRLRQGTVDGRVVMTL